MPPLFRANPDGARAEHEAAPAAIVLVGGGDPAADLVVKLAGARRAINCGEVWRRSAMASPAVGALRDTAGIALELPRG